jgi:hypothetical protein
MAVLTSARFALCDIPLVVCFWDFEKHTPGNAKLW